MKESNFTNELKASFRDITNSFYFKIPDMPHFRGARTKFDVKKPFDAFSVIEGRPIAIEAKMIKKWKPFGLKELRPNQVEALDAFERAGGESYVFLNVRIPRIKGFQVRENRLIIFPWKSIKKHQRFLTKELQALVFIQGFKGKFDLTTLKG